MYKKNLKSIESKSNKTKTICQKSFDRATNSRLLSHLTKDSSHLSNQQLTTQNYKNDDRIEVIS